MKSCARHRIMIYKDITKCNKISDTKACTTVPLQLKSILYIKDISCSNSFDWRQFLFLPISCRTFHAFSCSISLIGVSQASRSSDKEVWLMLLLLSLVYGRNSVIFLIDSRTWGSCPLHCCGH